MRVQTTAVWGGTRKHAGLLIGVAMALQATHITLLCAVKHPLIASNLCQLLAPLLAAAVCFYQRPALRNSIGRRCWTSTGWAFLIWSGAQLLFIWIELIPNHRVWSFRPDDLLWLMFGLPLLLAIATSQQDADQVAWLDRAQVILFFVVGYLLVFLPGKQLSLSNAYLIQNAALVLCCLLRLPSCSQRKERRFFFRLALFLILYSASETLATYLFRHGWEVGGFVDLCWTLPISCFVVLSLQDALRPAAEEQEASRFVAALNRFQGLSVAGLSFLSVGVAALLATRHPAIGGLLALAAFGLFAWRTNSRERLWQQAHRQLEHTVLRDSLTGLGNRMQLRESLGCALRSSESVEIALIFADLDRFKQINDNLGHALGDLLLIEVGRRLQAACPPDAVVCRLGGDEFIVLTRAETAAAAHSAGERILECLDAPFFPGAQDVRCTASIGVVLASPGETADDLLRTADHAMYRAKQQGRGRVQVFDSVMRAEMNARWEMESRLRQCVAQNNISVVFQPIYSIDEANLCGFEALARWHHPELGNVPPCAFIPLAEERGLIVQLGVQILEKACTQMAAWNAAWGTSFSVSVNVSPSQFIDSSLMPSLLGILQQTQLPPSLLRLEITETALLTNEAVVKDTLDQIRACGIRVSLDDFGTGYSSLSFLLSLPVDEVKVDRSFVSHMHNDPDREELVRTVIHLGHSLGKRVVAEGVETEQDLMGLAEMGCECAQGYLISAPLSADQMEAALPGIARRGKAIPSHGMVQPRPRPRFHAYPGPEKASSWSRLNLQSIADDTILLGEGL